MKYTLKGIKRKLYAIAVFLHIVDDDGRLNLTDVSLMVILVKLAVEPHLDWGAACTLIPVLLNKIHKRSVG